MRWKVKSNGSSLCDHFMRLYKGHLLCLSLGKPYAGPRLLGEFPFLREWQFWKLKIHKKLKMLMWRAAVGVLPMWHNFFGTWKHNLSSMQFSSGWNFIVDNFQTDSLFIRWKLKLTLLKNHLMHVSQEKISPCSQQYPWTSYGSCVTEWSNEEWIHLRDIPHKVKKLWETYITVCEEKQGHNISHHERNGASEELDSINSNVMLRRGMTGHA